MYYSLYNLKKIYLSGGSTEPKVEPEVEPESETATDQDLARTVAATVFRNVLPTFVLREERRLHSPIVKSLEKLNRLLENNKKLYNRQKFIKSYLQLLHKLMNPSYNSKNLSFEDCDRGDCCINSKTKKVTSPYYLTFEDCTKETTFLDRPVNQWIGPLSQSPYEFNSGLYNQPGLTIIPSVLSRLGDTTITGINQRYIINIINSYIQLLYYLEDIHQNILPSAYDSFMIDSKIHYMDLLLHYSLCDTDTIVLYFDLVNGKENTSLRSEKTLENIGKIMSSKPPYNFYIKTAFGGSSNCSKMIYNIKPDELNYMTLIKKMAGISWRKGIKGECLGKFYGLIIQPININFENILPKEKLYGELRCLCHKGNIKAIVADNRISHSIIKFKLIALHKSVLTLKKDLYLDDLVNNNKLQAQLSALNISLQAFKTLLNNECIKVYDHIPEFICYNFGTIFSSNIIDLCKQTYNIIKHNLEVTGIHHRIDIINSRNDNNIYVVNEIENINFGESVNDTITRSGLLINENIKDIAEYMKFYIKPSDESKDGLLKEHLTSIFIDWNQWDARKILLSFPN